MGKLFFKNRVRFFLIILFASFFCCFTGIDNLSSVSLVNVISSANYICILLNNLYIYYIYSRCRTIKSIFDKIITRIGQKSFFYQYVFQFLIDIFLFILIVIIPIYLRVVIDPKYNLFLILYLVLYFCNVFLWEIFSMLIFLLKKGNKFIILPILLNVFFHYLLIPFIMNHIFGL